MTATSASRIQQPHAVRQPPGAIWLIGTTTPDATAATPPITVAYAPVRSTTLAGKSRLIRLGSTTLPTAIPAPISTVPANRPIAVGAHRTAIPSVRTTSAPPRSRSGPHRAASRGTIGDIAANASNGTVFTSPATAGASPRSACTRSSNGPTPVKLARRFAATTSNPHTRSARLERRVDCFAFGEGLTGRFQR
jgi:hypothetical protein